MNIIVDCPEELVSKYVFTGSWFYQSCEIPMMILYTEVNINNILTKQDGGHSSSATLEE